MLLLNIQTSQQPRSAGCGDRMARGQWGGVGQGREVREGGERSQTPPAFPPFPSETYNCLWSSVLSGSQRNQFRFERRYRDMMPGSEILKTFCLDISLWGLRECSAPPPHPSPFIISEFRKSSRSDKELSRGQGHNGKDGLQECQSAKNLETWGHSSHASIPHKLADCVAPRRQGQCM